jgi:putative acetyltransferase
MRIRKAKPEDCRKIANLRKKTFEKINVKKGKYTKKQIEFLNKKNPPKKILEKMKKREMFCLVDKDKLLGVIGVEKNRIAGLFVRYNCMGKGLGKKLLNFIENHARKKDIKKLRCDSTIYARPFYLKQGYKLIKRKIGKLGIISYEMEKKI